MTKILIAEHDPGDIEMIYYELLKAGIKYVAEVVQNEQDYTNALEAFIPDIILSDYSFPSFNGATAFKIKEKISPATPFIVVSGTIGEENSIELIKNGVTDFVLKDKMFALNTKLLRALKDAENKKQKNKIEHELLLSETHLAEAQKLAKMGSWDLDIETGRLTWSKELYNVFGTDKKNSIDTYSSFIKLVDEEDRLLVQQKSRDTQLTGNPFTLEYHITTILGEKRIIREQGYGKKDAEGKINRLFGTAQDITESKRSEAALGKATEERNIILERIDDGFFATDKNAVVTYWNKRAEMLLDISKEAIIGKNLHEVFAATSSPEFYENYQEAINENSTVHFEGFSKRTNKWFAVSAFGSADGLSVYFKDVTEHKHSHSKLKESELRYRTLIEQATDAICIADSSMKFVNVNPYACELFGYTQEEALQLSLPDILFAEDLAANPVKVDELKLGITMTNERRLKRKDGTAVDMEVSTKIMEDGMLIMFGHDITKRKKAEQLISESEKKYRQIVETAQEGIWMIDENNKTTFVNRKMYELLEYTEEEMTGRTNLSFKDEGEMQNALQQIERRKQGQKEIHESKFITKSGREVWVHTSTNPIFAEDGKYAGALAMMTDITERKRAEQEMTWLINNTEESFILLNRNLDIISFNSQFYRLYLKYLAITVVKGDSILKYVQPERLDLIKGIYKHVLEGAEETGEINIQLPGNTEKIFALKYKPATDEQGTIIGVFVSAIDVTEKKQSEQQLIAQEKRYRALVENGADGVVIISPEGKLTYASPTVEKILGYTDEEILKLDMFSIVHPDDIDAVTKVWERVLASPGTALPGHTSRMLHKNGSWRWLEATVTNMLHDPALNGIVDNFRDVTEKIMAEEQLILNEKRYRALVENGADAVVILTAGGKPVYASPTLERVLGYTDAEALELDLFAMFHPDDIVWAVKVWEQVMISPGVPVPVRPSRMIHKDGGWRWLEGTLTNLLHDPAVLGIVDNFRDVTAKKELENLLNKTNSLARIGSWGGDMIKNTVYWSDITRVIYEVDDNYIPDLQKSLSFFKEGQSMNLITQKVKDAIENGISWDAELQIITIKGNEKWVRSIGETEFQNGKCIKLNGSFQDITDRKLGEIQLNELNENIKKHAKELAISNAELEQFAHVASHDLQEPLRMVTSFLTLLEKRYCDIIDEKGRQYIAFAVDGAKRMRQIILDLLEFSMLGGAGDNLENIDLKELVGEIKILFRKKIEEKSAQIIVEQLPQIVADRTPMRQVFQNLVGNALKYSRENAPSEIHISAKDLQTHWQFAVSDNGIGIAEEYYDKIFIIFQRLHNKDEFSGTGMGLAVTKKIIENLGGKIWLKSEENRGSTFYFTLLKHQ